MIRAIALTLLLAACSPSPMSLAESACGAHGVRPGTWVLLKNGVEYAATCNDGRSVMGRVGK